MNTEHKDNPDAKRSPRPRHFLYDCATGMLYFTPHKGAAQEDGNAAMGIFLSIMVCVVFWLVFFGVIL